MSGVTYPPDVQAALDHAAEEGWTTECYQAALAIALHHLEVAPARPEVVVMWTDKDISFTYIAWQGYEAEGRIGAGSVYLVCPMCRQPTAATWWQPALETASVSIEEEWAADEGPSEVSLWRGDWDSSGDGSDGYLMCNRWQCGAELAVPVWLDCTD